MFYADPVADEESPTTREPSPGDDPFFIVPAVLPDENPVTPAPSAREPRPSTVTEPVPAPPVPIEPTRARAVVFERRPARRTTRIVRHVDAWSVFKVALVFHFVLYLTLLLAGVLLWNVANATGTVDNVERFLESFGWESFDFKGSSWSHLRYVCNFYGTCIVLKDFAMYLRCCIQYWYILFSGFLH